MFVARISFVVLSMEVYPLWLLISSRHFISSFCELRAFLLASQSQLHFFPLFLHSSVGPESVRFAGRFPPKSFVPRGTLNYQAHEDCLLTFPVLIQSGLILQLAFFIGPLCVVIKHFYMLDRKTALIELWRHFVNMSIYLLMLPRCHFLPHSECYPNVPVLYSLCLWSLLWLLVIFPTAFMLMPLRHIIDSGRLPPRDTAPYFFFEIW